MCHIIRVFVDDIYARGLLEFDARDAGDDELDDFVLARRTLQHIHDLALEHVSLPQSSDGVQNDQFH